MRGDRSQPDAYANLAGKKWDVVIDTGTNVPWTREAVARARRAPTGRYMYVSSTGVFLPYRTVDIPEDGPVPLTDTPPQDPPSYGVIKAQQRTGGARRACPAASSIIRPGYIVGPGDTSDRFTYWPVRIARGGEVLVPGRKTDFVQYIDVRDLAEWMVASHRPRRRRAPSTRSGPATKQTLAQFVDGLRPLATAPVTLHLDRGLRVAEAVPAAQAARRDDTAGLTYAIPWVMPEGDDLGHVHISNRKAIAAGLTFRPLLTTARDTIAWRASDAVPEAIRKQPRYVLTPEQETAMLAAWKARAAK